MSKMDVATGCMEYQAIGYLELRRARSGGKANSPFLLAAESRLSQKGWLDASPAAM